MIQVEHISKIYKTGEVEVPALQDVTFTVNKGEFVAIMGPSGSGKSTLMNILGALDIPTTGEYVLDGENVGALTDDQLAEIRNRKIGFVFQLYNLLPRTSALKNVMLPMMYGGIPKELRREKAEHLLKQVGLGDRLSHTASQLSGGQQQRVAIARALSMDPSIILADEPTGNIASAQAREIMEIFQDLNDRGNTILMITHEQDIAHYAKRIIKIRDGKLDIDSKTAARSWRERGPNMEARELIVESFGTLSLNKIRTGLAMLGVVIGIGSVIALVSLGQASQRSVENQIKSLGSNLLTVSPGAQTQGGIRGMAGGATTLTNEDAQAIKDSKEITSVSDVSPEYSQRAQAVAGRNNTNTQIIGVAPQYSVVRNINVASGSFITQRNVEARSKVAVLGPQAAEDLFGEDWQGSDPIGKSVRIDGQSFLVIGVTESKGGTGFQNQDDRIYIPLTTAQKTLFGSNYLTSIAVAATSEEVMEQARNEIGYLLLERHRISDPYQADFSIFSQEDILGTPAQITETFTALLSGIAAISLVVGGIGIMNIMLVTVTERTREIGLRKALGAKRKTITAQFLFEAVIITFVGGLIGVVAGIIVSYFLSNSFGLSFGLSFPSILLAFGVSTVIGIIFGWYPARKASLLEPIEALRYE